jgi:hypothetical protein
MVSRVQEEHGRPCHSNTPSGSQGVRNAGPPPFGVQNCGEWTGFLRSSAFPCVAELAGSASGCFACLRREWPEPVLFSINAVRSSLLLPPLDRCPPCSTAATEENQVKNSGPDPRTLTSKKPGCGISQPESVATGFQEPAPLPPSASKPASRSLTGGPAGYRRWAVERLRGQPCVANSDRRRLVPLEYSERPGSGGACRVPARAFRLGTAAALGCTR